ncbi:MAG: hypothetical protein QF473_25900 [Planctomycetota bacterium]|nr:hypothetical protein [Planctomycetota bacterium]
MERKSYCLGLAALLAVLTLPDFSFAGGNRFAVVEVEDENERISYHIVPARQAQTWARNRTREGEKLVKQWKDLPFRERKKAEKPGDVRVRIKKYSLKTEEEAKEYAEKLLEKVPSDERASDEVAVATAKKKAKGKARDKAKRRERDKEKVEKED